MKRGITLVELLVVITIMMVLAAFVLPKLQLNGEGRRIREAARLTSVFLNSARSRAAETNRPVGVLFERSAVNQHAVTILRQVEVPPLYAGDVLSSAVQCEQVTATGHVRLRIQLAAWGDKLIRPGDMIQFNGQGRWLRITSGGVPVDADGYLEFSRLPDNEVRADVWLREWAAANPGVPPPVIPSTPDGWADDPAWIVCEPTDSQQRVYPYSNEVPAQVIPGMGPFVQVFSEPTAFSVRRQPQPTVSPPVVLPGGTCLDMTASGFRRSWFRSPDPVILMFTPDGTVERLYWYDGTTRHMDSPSDPLFFLAGLLSHVPEFTATPSAVVFGQRFESARDEDKPNWQLMSSRWVSVNPRTGITAVAENATVPTYWRVVDPDSPDMDPGTAPEMRGWEAIDEEGRAFAREGAGIGGSHL